MTDIDALRRRYYQRAIDARKHMAAEGIDGRLPPNPVRLVGNIHLLAVLSIAGRRLLEALDEEVPSDD